MLKLLTASGELQAAGISNTASQGSCPAAQVAAAAVI